MSIPIPGLSVLAAENMNSANVIKISSFIGNAEIPESHRHGNCRRIDEFVKVSDGTRGKFFDTYLCRDKKAENKGYRCLKRFKMHHNFANGVPKEILREFNILNTLNHENIIKSFGPATKDSLRSNYLILDSCCFSLKDVIDEIIPICEKSVVKCIVQQLFLGLQYIHSARIIHRNICGENILFNNEGILKITGFHFSCFDNGDVRTPVQSEKRYQAPELLLYSDTKTYDSKIDMWSAGCVLVEFGLKKPLFTGDTNIEVLNSIFKVLGTPNDILWPGFDELFALIYDGKREILNPMPYCDLKAYITGVSTSCFDIIKNLLFYSAKPRFSAKECLELSYFKENPTACSKKRLAVILEAFVTAIPETPVTTTT